MWSLVYFGRDTFLSSKLLFKFRTTIKILSNCFFLITSQIVRKLQNGKLTQITLSKFTPNQSTSNNQHLFTKT